MPLQWCQWCVSNQEKLHWPHTHVIGDTCFTSAKLSRCALHRVEKSIMWARPRDSGRNSAECPVKTFWHVPSLVLHVVVIRLQDSECAALHQSRPNVLSFWVDSHFLRVATCEECCHDGITHTIRHVPSCTESTLQQIEFSAPHCPTESAR